MVTTQMHTFGIPINRANSLMIAAIVLIASGCMFVAFELGGVTAATIFHALCLSVCVGYFIDEPRRVQRKVRKRTSALQDLAYRDGLTGLPNRRFFHWYLEQYLPRQSAPNTRPSIDTHVVLFDLNGFKGVNDNHGHDAGDELLKFIAETLSAQLPPDVLLSRLGGDEFVVLVRDQRNGRKLQRVLNTIRKSAKSPLKYEDKSIQVSASIGVSSTHRKRPNLSQMLREADRLMYVDKAAQKKSAHPSPVNAFLNLKLEAQ